MVPPPQPYGTPHSDPDGYLTHNDGALTRTPMGTPHTRTDGTPHTHNPMVLTSRTPMVHLTLGPR
ncbi:hypothetical protein STEG23_020045, partial [Scotinomys teguina]